MKKIIGLIIIAVMMTVFLGVQYIVLSGILKKSSDLIGVRGRITAIEKIKKPKRTVGYNYAYVLKINSSPMRFAIHDYHERAYAYLSHVNVINSSIRILYDEDGYNSTDDLTYHVCSLSINNRHLLEIEESKRGSKYELIIFFFADLFIFAMLFFAYKEFRKNRYSKYKINVRR